MLNVIHDRTSPEWMWGLDVFWMALLAAFPLFPSGNWDQVWNARIPMSGNFITAWRHDLEPVGRHECGGNKEGNQLALREVHVKQEDGHSLDDGLDGVSMMTDIIDPTCMACIDIRTKIWAQFQGFISMYYPYPLVEQQDFTA